MIITDEYINKLFEGTNFGGAVDSSVRGKRVLLSETLNNQLGGYWSGHTAYHIAVNGGFLVDAKSGDQKRLTLLGKIFLEGEES